MILKKQNKTYVQLEFRFPGRQKWHRNYLEEKKKKKKKS